MFKKYHILSIVFFVIFALPIIVSPASATLVNIEPDTQTISNVGDMTTVDIHISDVTNLYGFQIKIIYNKSILEVQNFIDGDILNSDGKSPFYFEPDSSEEGARIYTGTRTGSVPGINGSGILFSVTFKGITSGSTEITLSEVYLSDPSATPITSDITHGSVTVGGIPSDYIFSQALTSKDVESVSPWMYIDQTSQFNLSSDNYTYAWLEIINVYVNTRARFDWYLPNGNLITSHSTDWTGDPQSSGYTSWDWVRLNDYINIHGLNAGNNYFCKIFVDAGNGFDYVTTINFNLVGISPPDYVFGEAVTCKGVQSESPWDYIDATTTFNPAMDNYIYAWLRIDSVYIPLRARFDFYNPNGGLIATKNTGWTDDPSEGGHPYWSNAKYYDYIETAGLQSGNNYSCKIYIDDGSGFTQISTLNFIISSSIGIDVVYVDINSSPDGTGNSWDEALNSLQAGINAAKNQEKEVWVAQGTYNEAINMEDGIPIYGGFSGNETNINQRNFTQNITVIDGNGLNMSVVTAANNAIIDGFTIKNGNDDWGGGIYCPEDITFFIYNNIIENNTANISGGGLFINDNAMITVKGNTIRNNQAHWGGALYADNIAQSSIEDNKITNNTVTYQDQAQDSGGYGGALYLHGNNVDVTDNTISYNTAAQDGGGICIFDGTVSIIHNEIFQNSSEFGGGIIDQGSSSISNNTLHHNNATLSGGGIFLCKNSTSTLTGNKLLDNEARYGGGIFVDEGASPLIESNLINGNEGKIVNSEGGNGGGLNLYLVDSGTKVCKNLFQSNNAGWGGALIVWEGSGIEIFNNIMLDNHASDNGGAFLCKNGSSISLTNNTFYMNDSLYDGSCVSVWGTASVFIMNSIFYESLDFQPLYVDTQGGSSLSITYSDTYGWNEPGTGNMNQYPVFIDPQVLDFHLNSTSLCINKGNPASQYNDLDGSQNDMGAYGGQDPICIECFSMTLVAKGVESGRGFMTSKVITGIGETYDTLPFIPPLSDYPVIMKINDISIPSTHYCKDLRAYGTTYEKWIIEVDVPGSIKETFPSSYYPLLSWNVNDFCPVGIFSLWTSDLNGNPISMLVNDMRTISSHQIKKGEGMLFCIYWSSISAVTKTYNLPKGWSMISLPVLPDNASVQELFPDAVVVYSYEKGSGYVRVPNKEKLEIGKGYWILLNEEKSHSLTGQSIHKYSISVNEDGWHMIGGCTYQAKASTNNANVCVIYSYAPETGYKLIPESENLICGKGYWILLNKIAGQAKLNVETVNP